MLSSSKSSSFILGVFICIGLIGLGCVLGNTAIQYKEYERTVRVKGLSEKEFNADIIIRPIQFTEASNDLTKLYASLDLSTSKIRTFLEKNGVSPDEITVAPPNLTDKSAQSYGGNSAAPFRYTATQSVTIYSKNIDNIQKVIGKMSELGKAGIVVTGEGAYEARTEYIFTRLNEVKPEMVEEATKKAREVAQKFAEDSQSTLGKIKRADQGTFSIRPRDKNNPHIKTVRVVSTVEYYLSD